MVTQLTRAQAGVMDSRPGKPPDRRQLGARVSSDLYRRLRVLAAERETTISALVEEAIRDLLSKYARSRRTHG